jgi:hypothetical protein
MTTPKAANTLLVPVVESVPRISDAERAELLASLARGSADIAAGRFREIGPETLKREFEAILEHDLSDAELDAMPDIPPGT